MTARRPKISSSDLARRGRGEWSTVPERIRQRVNLAARQAAANIMNDLAERGPAYTGEFRDSWRTIPIGKGATPAPPGGYPYSTRNVPQLSTTVKEMQRVKVFEIINVSPYALYAMDIIPGFFRKPKGVEPLGGIEFGVKYGERKVGESFRYEVYGDGEGVSTAEKDWYENYVKGGGISATVSRSIKLAMTKGDVGVRFR